MSQHERWRNANEKAVIGLATAAQTADDTAAIGLATAAQIKDDTAAAGLAYTETANGKAVAALTTVLLAS
jgi:hypothetical protein